MCNNKGITLIIVIMTIILLAIIAGVSITIGVKTYRNAQIVDFETTMAIIQKKVDIIVEEGENIENYGQSPNARSYGKIDYIKSQYENTAKYIVTTPEEVAENVRGNATGIRYFTAKKMKSVFGIDTKSEFLINFKTREVINLTGAKIGGETFFVVKGLHEVLD